MNTTPTVNGTQELVHTGTGPQPLDRANRASDIDDLLEKVALVHKVMRRVMKEDEHYGTIPGCKKPSLYKPGAEKLALVFRLKAIPDVTFTDLGNDHREYVAKVTLSDGTGATGSCSTLEGKYRFQQGERRCPKCGNAAIRKSKDEYGGGFYCNPKQGGCNEKFPKDSEEILSQKIGKVEYDNPADFWNTCRQMATKRAFVQAIRQATGCSDVFNPEPEDEPEDKKPEQPKSKTIAYDAVQIVSVGAPKEKDGKTWRMVTFNDGPGGDPVKAWSCDAVAVKLAQELKDTGETAKVATETDEKGNVTVKAIDRRDAPPE